MCEILAVAWEEPQPLEKALLWAREVERLGIARFGWGAAWVSEDGRLRGYRRPTSLADDPEGSDRVASQSSRRVLIHLRRPSFLSTVQLASTQPFVEPRGRYAFAHNGFFKRHIDYRPRYQDLLEGNADSEVGFQLFDSLLESRSPEAALQAVHEELRGTANLAYLSGEGDLHVYGGNRGNPFWKFRFEGATVACTGLHSRDDSLFALLFQEPRNLEVVERETATVGTAIAGYGPGQADRSPPETS
jgi:predicted glutamine amidotransferase